MVVNDHLRKNLCFIRDAEVSSHFTAKLQAATAGQVRVTAGSAAGAAAVKGETAVVCLM